MTVVNLNRTSRPVTVAERSKAVHTLTSPARRGAGLELISPHTYERGDPHTDEFGSLETEPSRTREPDSYV
jgi:hypothetical protein